ncbi:type II toxin-antitoxin system HicB family antitoxin [Candidatus Magnetobacterium casense]|uniref:type II toxin-antitoxin system HicB family antitoxin n=1 Tax=Candidatus Magnetobacterium casense TaxID=1455061 RepID=UPI000B05826E|nr:hypothetical protein [Candidatus Magnetobacterium casensis]
MTIETEQEEDGRWIAEVPDIAGALAYGDTRNEAIVHVKVLALRIMADRLEEMEVVPEMDELFSVTA